MGECFLASSNMAVLGKANVNLSNLTSTGENHFANKSLSNLNTTGEGHFDTKISTMVNTAISSMLGTLYPVGSIYIGTQSSCPLATLISGSQWQQIQGYYLCASGTLAGTSNESIQANGYFSAGLPDLGGNAYAGVVNNNASADGVFQLSWWGGRGAAVQANYNGARFNFTASRNHSTYGQSSTVRPSAYGVNVWRRIS